MARSVLQFGEVNTRRPIPGRLLGAKGSGWRRVTIPPGRYDYVELAEDPSTRYELQDKRYYCRLTALDELNPFRGRRLRVWEADLVDGTR